MKFKRAQNILNRKKDTSRGPGSKNRGDHKHYTLTCIHDATKRDLPCCGERACTCHNTSTILNPMAEAELYERYIRAYNAWYFSDSDYEFPAGRMVRDCFVMD